MSDGLAAAVFWFSVVGLLYAYVAYPTLLRLAPPRTIPVAAGHARPSACVVVAAHDERGLIERKVTEVLRQLDPADELIVVSDGSTDGTDAVVAGVSDARLRLLRQEPQQGKNAALNRGVAEARGDLLVFTDANALPAPGALDRLLAPFVDPAVGLVSGQGLYGTALDGDTRVVSNAYVRYEAGIRRGEAALGFMAGVDGALYAMRRELYTELPHDQVHDLLHPIQVALAGRRVVFVPEAFTIEPPSSGAASEWRRQVRIIAQGFRVVGRMAPVLLGRGLVKELWMLVSHRLLRWLGWFLALVALVANVALVEVHPLYRVLLAAQGAFYAVAVAGALGERFSVPLRILALPYYFCVVSYAGLVGLVEALRGRTHATWAAGGSSS